MLVFKKKKKKAWKTSHRQKEPSNKAKLCHIILGRPWVSICCEEGIFGPNYFHWPRHPTRKSTAFPGSLIQPVLASCNSRPSFSLFCQSPLPETNPQFQFAAEITILSAKKPVRAAMPLSFFLNSFLFFSFFSHLFFY